ncbi:probable rRNA-processing protein EBP2 [Watersipora subatra]|uniref:probable rRNA-processing protein EBP2 n=1 Tax=Watersipora subatra TaxID=2589382 RepID=UPI00355B0B34
MKRKQARMEDSSEDDDILDSDEELQKAFARGDLQSGTYKELTPKEKIINDISGLEAKLKLLSRASLDWIERLDITTEHEAEDEEGKDDSTHDDFQRELQFYTQAKEAILLALPRLHKLRVPTKRPEDYFAQMVKSDEHMKKVREKLLATSIAAERSEKAKKLREMKKMGKKVQVEVLKSRQKNKKEMLEQVKKYRKGQQDRLDFLEGDMEKPQKSKAGAKKQLAANNPRSNKRRDWKNQKFGFGGQKKRSKSNTKDSYNDSRDYSVSKNSKGYNPKGKGKKKSNTRPGKSKRQQMKNKR